MAAPASTSTQHSPQRTGRGQARGSRRGAARRDGQPAPGAPAPPGAPVAAGPVRASLRSEPRPGRIGALLIQQLIMLQLAAVLVVLPLAVGPKWLVVPGGAVAAALAVAAIGRWRGRWLVQWPAIMAGFRSRARARRRSGPGGASGPPGQTDPSGVPVGGASETDRALAPVLECAPELTTSSFTDRDRRGIGMVGDGTFLTALLLVAARDEPLRPARSRHPLPLQTVVDALAVDDVVLASAQIVQHTQPAPATHLPEEALAARAYRQLAEQLGARTAPGLRLTWIALRFEPERCPTAVAARGGGLVGAQRALLRTVNQLSGRLIEAGFTARPLTEDELVQALAASCSVNPLSAARQSQGGRPVRRTAETRHGWRCDDRWHTTYWAGRWPQLSSTTTPDLISTLTSVPALATTYSLTVTPGSGGAVGLSSHVRVAARSENELGRITRQLEQRARASKVGLVRLDFEQQPGLLATLPLGGAL